MGRRKLEGDKKMNRTDELFFELIETYQRHAQAAKNTKYQETREMAK